MVRVPPPETAKGIEMDPLLVLTGLSGDEVEDALEAIFMPVKYDRVEGEILVEFISSATNED